MFMDLQIVAGEIDRRFDLGFFNSEAVACNINRDVSDMFINFKLVAV